MFALYTLGGMAPSFQDHGTSARFPFPFTFDRLDPFYEGPLRYGQIFNLRANSRATRSLCGPCYQWKGASTSLVRSFSLLIFPCDIFCPLASGSADKTIKLWKQHKCLRTYHGHKDAVRTLALLTDIGFASGSNDRSVYGYYSS